LIVLAVAALVGIGSTEALISNEQLSQLPGRGRPPLGSGGVALTIIGIALSTAVYCALGLFLAHDDARESAVLAIGIGVGAGAGLIGGTIRAYLVRDYLGGVLAGYGLANLLVLTLAVFVALSTVVSVAAGAALTWLGFRGGRRPRTRQPPS
jgi:cation transporter-like permease